jgi:hypothetical protein
MAKGAKQHLKIEKFGKPPSLERPTITIWTVLSAARSVTTLSILESARTPIQSLKSITSTTIAQESARSPSDSVQQRNDNY